MATDTVQIAADATAAIVVVNAAISTVGTLQGAGIKVLATVAAAVESALVPFDKGIASLDAGIDLVTVGGVAAGMIGPELADALNAQAAEMSQLATLVKARAYLARAGVNVEEAPG